MLACVFRHYLNISFMFIAPETNCHVKLLCLAVWEPGKAWCQLRVLIQKACLCRALDVRPAGKKPYLKQNALALQTAFSAKALFRKATPKMNYHVQCPSIENLLHSSDCQHQCLVIGRRAAQKKRDCPTTREITLCTLALFTNCMCLHPEDLYLSPITLKLDCRRRRYPW